MILPHWLLGLRKIMGKIADVVIAGRNLGLYDERKGPRF
jgi:hypothetical protein